MINQRERPDRPLPFQQTVKMLRVFYATGLIRCVFAAMKKHRISWISTWLFASYSFVMTALLSLICIVIRQLKDHDPLPGIVAGKQVITFDLIVKIQLLHGH